MAYLLFVFYLVLFTWLVTRVPFFRNSGLSGTQLICLFLIKVLAGISYGWIGINFNDLIQMGDTWRMHFQGIEEYRVLVADPASFFGQIFQNNYSHGYTRFLSSQNSWWNDLDQNIFTKMLGVWNLFTRGNYFSNVVVYSFLTLFGPVAFFRIATDAFPGNKGAIILGCFLVPSFIYWCSGLHKDGLNFLGLAGIIYPVYYFLQGRRPGLRHIFSILTGIFLLLVFRNYLILLLIPALLTWTIAHRAARHAGKIFASLYLFYALVLLSSPLFGLNLMQPFVEKQQDFRQLRGHSYVPLTMLEPDHRSFVRVAPEAMVNAALRPFPWDARKPLALVASLEISGLLLLLVLASFFPARLKRNRPFLFFCLFYSISVLLVIGYTVNFLGAIVRYRSLVFPLVTPPLLAGIDWQRIKNHLHIK